MSEQRMTETQLRALCVLLIPSWITSDENEALVEWADDEARRHGFDSWVDAYHAL